LCTAFFFLRTVPLPPIACTTTRATSHGRTTHRAGMHQQQHQGKCQNTKRSGRGAAVGSGCRLGNAPPPRRDTPQHQQDNPRTDVAKRAASFWRASLSASSSIYKYSRHAHTSRERVDQAQPVGGASRYGHHTHQ
jgi:hypothetical protein